MGAPKDPEKYEEWKRKISEANKGNQNAKGLKHSDEAKHIIAEKSKAAWELDDGSRREQIRNMPRPCGRKFSEETKAKMSRSHTGMVMPKVVSEKLSQRNREKWASMSPEERSELMGNRVRAIFAGPRADIVRQKASQSARKRWESISPEKRQRFRDILSAIRGTPEMRQRMSERSRSWWASLSSEERSSALEKCIGAMRAALENRPTSIELAVYNVLDNLGVPYVPEKNIGPYFVDIVFVNHKAIIECDGEYWHSLPGSEEYDAKRQRWLERHGYKVVRLAEKDIRKNVNLLVKKALLELGLGGEIGIGDKCLTE